MQISKLGKKLVTSDKNYDPKDIAEYTGDSEQALWEYLEDFNTELRIADKERKANLPDVRPFRDSFPPEFRQKLRAEHLVNKINNLTRKFESQCVQIAQKPDSITEGEIAHTENQLHREMLHLKIVRGYTQGITAMQIEKAREYPITNLIEHKKFMAICPFHNEKTPSLFLKNNFYHCFGCGANGDVIDFIMLDRSMSFKEAVEYLSND